MYVYVKGVGKWFEYISARDIIHLSYSGAGVLTEQFGRDCYGYY